MSKMKTKRQSANWQVTVTSVHCDMVGDLVTIMVYKDWSTKCGWYNRYKQKILGGKRQKFDKRIRHKVMKCTGPECSHMTMFRDKLIDEEFGSKSNK